MHRAYLLIVTAFGEAGIGLLLLVLPSVPLALLLGIKGASRESILVARLLGAALLAIGIGCWLGRRDTLGPSQRALITGALVYDGAIAMLLAYAGISSNSSGIALWPAVMLHVVLAVWCLVSLRSKPPELS
jgi:hypothetical protein